MHRVTSGEIVGGRRRALEVTTLRRHKLALLIAILAVVLPACGTRLPDSAFVKAQQGASGSKTLAAGDQPLDESGNPTGGDQGTAGAAGSGGGATGGSAGTAGK